MNDPKIASARAELESLARRPAYTTEERYRVLEAKDRYIRLTTERTTDIRKARNIEGTCQDMCPEKERYLREWKCMVPPYERISANSSNGIQIDHAKAVKQYSRSSADQELPLPHELRTERALGRTMHYLLVNHADRCEGTSEEIGGNVSDWFHYIWDRTRGIRKDIIQQDLCSLTVVELVEQCTRFHIHCAARLVTEDPSIFDQKINTENMTKSLQTLKYMYADLAQRGERCPNEPEFRAYMILLYLNDGNFLWELKQLHESIIHSHEIKFALSVYFALEKNNYVRFFELVRETNYMNACILLRYFTQVRQQALDVLRKAYALRSSASFTLSYLSRILGFEDESDAVGFFEHYGVTVDRANGIVLFEGKQSTVVYKPDLPYPTGRAIHLVESKRTGSIGEAICGAPLEQWGKQFPPAQHVSSFDARGCLREQLLENVLGLRPVNAEQEEISRSGPNEFQLASTNQLDQLEADNYKNPFADHNSISMLSASRVRMPLQSKFYADNPVFEGYAAPSIKTSLSEDRSSIISQQDQKSFRLDYSGQSQAKDLCSQKSSNGFFRPGDVIASFPNIIPPAAVTLADSTTTMSYVSPPTNKTITPAGQKRTFFGAVKTTESIVHAALTPPISLSTPFSSDQTFLSKNLTTHVPQTRFTQQEMVARSRDGVNVVDTCGLQRSDLFQPAKNAPKQEMKYRMNEKEMQQREIQLAAIEVASKQELAKLFDHILPDFVEQIAEQTIARQKWMESYTYNLFSELSQELIDEVLTTYARMEMSIIEQKRERWLKTKYWHLWLHNARNAIRWHRLMESVILSQCAFYDMPNYDRLQPIFDARFMSSSQQTPPKIPLDSKICGVVKPLESFPESELIDPFKILQNSLRSVARFGSYSLLPALWKLTISVPSECDGNADLGFSKFILRWLSFCAFKRIPDREIANHSYFFLEACITDDIPEEQRAAICMRLVRGSLALDETNKNAAKACDRTNGLLFFVSDNVCNENVQKRLECLIQKTEYPPPAIAFILFQPNSTATSNPAEFGKLLGVYAKQVSWKLFSWRLPSSNNTLRDALSFLSDCYKYQLEEAAKTTTTRLEMLSLRVFLDRCIGSELWYRWESSCSSGVLPFPSLGKLAQNANAVVQLYNDALDRVKSMATNNDLQDYSHIPEDFNEVRERLMEHSMKKVLHQPVTETYFPLDWSSSDRRNQLQQLFEDLKLHNIPEVLLDTIDHVSSAAINRGLGLSVTMLKEEMRRYLMNYCTILDQSQIAMLEQLLVNGVVLQLIGCSYTSETRPLVPACDELANPRALFWIPLIHLIADVVQKAVLTRVALPSEVFFVNDDFTSFTEQQWWTESTVLMHGANHNTASKAIFLNNTLTPSKVTQNVETRYLSPSKTNIDEAIARAMENLARIKKSKASTSHTEQEDSSQPPKKIKR